MIFNIKFLLRSITTVYNVAILTWIYLAVIAVTTYAELNICSKQFRVKTHVNEKFVNPGGSVRLNCYAVFIDGSQTSPIPPEHIWKFIHGDSRAWSEWLMLTHKTATGETNFYNEDLYNRENIEYIEATNNLIIRNATEADQRCYRCVTLGGTYNISSVFSVMVIESTTPVQQSSPNTPVSSGTMATPHLCSVFLMLFITSVVTSHLQLWQ